MIISIEPFDIDNKYLRYLHGIASLIYFLPGIISSIIILFHLIFERDTNLLFVNFWFLLSFAIFNLLVAIGLYKRNIIAWWSAIIWPIVVWGYGYYWHIYCVNQKNLGNNSRSIEMTEVVSEFIMQVGIYYLVGMIIIIPTKVKVLFKKADNIKNDEQ